MAKYRCIVPNKIIVLKCTRIDIIDGFKVPVPSLTIKFKNHFLNTTWYGDRAEEVEKGIELLLTGMRAARWNKMIIRQKYDMHDVQKGLDKQIDVLKQKKEALESARVVPGMMTEKGGTRLPTAEDMPTKIDLTAPAVEEVKTDGETKPDGNGSDQSDSKED